MITDRRRNPGEDVVSALLAAEAEGDRLDMAELMAFVVLLYVAGHETTVNLIGNGVLALLNHPDQLAAWRDDPALDSVAVDELLRYDGPVQQTVRAPLRTSDLPRCRRRTGGSSITAQVVITCLGAANRDPGDVSRTRSADPRPTERQPSPRVGVWSALLPRGASLAWKRNRYHPPHSTIPRSFELVGTPTWRDR